MSLNRLMQIISVNYLQRSFRRFLVFFLLVSFFCIRTVCFVSGMDLINDSQEEVKSSKVSVNGGGTRSLKQVPLSHFFKPFPQNSSRTPSLRHKRKRGDIEDTLPATQDSSRQDEQETKDISPSTPKRLKLSPESPMQTPSLENSSRGAPKKGTKRKAEEEAGRENPKKQKSEKKLNLNVYLLKKIDQEEQPLMELATVDEYLSEVLPYISGTKHSLINVSPEGDHFITFQKMEGIVPGEEIYIFKEVGTRKLDWLERLHAQETAYRRKEVTRNLSYHEPNSHEEVKGAVIIVKKVIAGHSTFFALTFGITGRFLLNFDLCDSVFAKHHVYNLLSSDPNYRAKAFSEIDLDEQKLKSEEAKYHGKVEVTRGIRAFVPMGLKVTDGKRALGAFRRMHICMNDTLDFETIGGKCEEFLKMSQKQDYQKKYSEIDYFTPLEDEDLIERIFDKAHKHMFIEFPFEINDGISPDDFCQFSIQAPHSICSAHFERTYDDFSEFAEDLKRFCGTQKKGILRELKKIKIIGKASSQRFGTWRTDHLVSAEVDYDGKTYWIEGKDVFEVSNHYVDMVNKRLDAAFFDTHKSSSKRRSSEEPSSLKLLGNFSEEDKRTNRRKQKDGTVVESISYEEGVYAKRMAQAYPEEFMLLDRQNIRVQEDTNSHSVVEPADLISREGDFIHLKRYTGSSENVYYVNAQGLNSATLFLKNLSYRRQVLKKIAERKGFTKTGRLLEQREFQVVFGLIHHNDDFKPSSLAINAKLDLYRSFQKLDGMGIKGKIIAIKDDTLRLSTKKPKVGDKEPSSLFKQKGKPGKKHTSPTYKTKLSSSVKRKLTYLSAPPASLADDLASAEQIASSALSSTQMDIEPTDQDGVQKADDSDDEEEMDSKNSVQDLASENAQLMEHEYTNLDIQGAIEASLSSVPGLTSFEINGGKYFRLNNRIITPAITKEGDDISPAECASRVLATLFETLPEDLEEILMPFNPGGHWVVLHIMLQIGDPKINYIEPIAKFIKGLNKKGSPSQKEFLRI